MLGASGMIIEKVECCRKYRRNFNIQRTNISFCEGQNADISERLFQV